MDIFFGIWMWGWSLYDRCLKEVERILRRIFKLFWEIDIRNLGFNIIICEGLEGGEKFYFKIRRKGKFFLGKCKILWNCFFLLYDI